MSKFREFADMEKNELKSRFAELKKELIKLNAQVATGTAPKNPGQIKQIKKSIARILTAMNRKEVKAKKK